MRQTRVRFFICSCFFSCIFVKSNAIDAISLSYFDNSTPQTIEGSIAVLVLDAAEFCLVNTARERRDFSARLFYAAVKR